MSGSFGSTQIWEPFLRPDIFSLLEGLESSLKFMILAQFSAFVIFLHYFDEYCDV